MATSARWLSSPLGTTCASSAASPAEVKSEPQQPAAAAAGGDDDVIFVSEKPGRPFDYSSIYVKQEPGVTPAVPSGAGLFPAAPSSSAAAAAAAAAGGGLKFVTKASEIAQRATQASAVKRPLAPGQLGGSLGSLQSEGSPLKRLQTDSDGLSPGSIVVDKVKRLLLNPKELFPSAEDSDGGGAGAAVPPPPVEDEEMTSWSCTIGAGGSDVPTWWLRRTEAYMCTFNITSTKAGEASFKEHYKTFMPIKKEDGSKLTFKPLAEGQTFGHMLGYVQKDSGLPHYQLVSHNVTAAELEEGRVAYSEVSGDYKIGCIPISKSGLADRVWSFWTAHFKPFWAPVDVILLHMIRSRKYFPCGTWTTSSQGKPVDKHMHRAWHMMVTRPHDVQLEHIGILFWGTHLSQPCGKFRYFITAAPDGADSLLTKRQLASEQLFFRHAYEIETTLMVCADVRKCLQVLRIAYSDSATVDRVFVDCFDVAYERATGSAPEQAAPAAAGSGAAPEQQQQQDTAAWVGGWVWPQEQQQQNTASWAGGWVWPQEQQQQTGGRVDVTTQDYIPLL
ncbi:hypothetical protein OEZ85_014357 [Tetradesmus obliquus]|uniref:START domain-containing protein n=1 Tax=Tetradesmus obliquus TaxID=3088 RepID=A0ABY8U8L2_TETOB|nr:hypothetical protein OEZ85_014357 [Tetradesmus obliquus]